MHINNNLLFNERPNIAVLLAAYNGSEWIESQIKTIINQKNVNITLFISVDLSDDDTLHIVKHCASIDENIKVLSYGERYGSAARNFFRLIGEVDFASFDYISLSDQDDIWGSHKCHKAISELNSNNAMGYSSNVIAFWPSNRESIVIKSQKQTKWDYFFESAGPGCTYVMNKSLALELQRFILENKSKIDEVWMHDWFIYAFSRFYNYKWIIDKDALIRYRQHESNVIGVNKGFKAYHYRLRKVLNGEYFSQVLLISDILKAHNIKIIKYMGMPFGYCRLATQAFQCRRRPLEKLLFFFAANLVCLIKLIRR
jgi:rhamnosyltransferase